jgi:DNA-binding FadR family transcriptional regulator
MAKQPLTKNRTFSLLQMLGQEIVSGKYDNKKFPTEAELCEQFNVSRTITREAIKMLTSKRILASRPRIGIVIQPEQSWNLLDKDVLAWLLKRKVSISLLREFTHARLGIEPQGAWLAAKSATDEQKQRILEAIDDLEAAARGESDPFQADINLHISIIQASNNRFISQLSDVVETALRFSIRMTNRFKSRSMGAAEDYSAVADAIVEDHRAVVDAIIAGDAELARKGMSTMLEETLELINSVEAEE